MLLQRFISLYLTSIPGESESIPIVSYRQNELEQKVTFSGIKLETNLGSES
jgi:hypothetical protein